jgi:hypothetical protein
MCLLVILSMVGCAATRTGLRCGDECRVETHAGEVILGILQASDPDFLTLGYSSRGGLFTRTPQFTRTIALHEVRAIYSVKRSTATGFLLGATAGIAVALAAGKDWITKCESRRMLGCMEAGIGKGVLVGVGGFFVGGALGGAAGYGALEFEEVSIRALPDCCPFHERRLTGGPAHSPASSVTGTPNR